MNTFRDLRKASKTVIDNKEIKMVLMGNVATQFIATSVCGAAKLEGINLNITDIDYNQIDVQVLDRQSLLYKSMADYILIWLSSEKIYEEFLDLPLLDRSSFAEQYMEKINNWWRLILSGTNARIMQTNLVEIDDKALGQYSAKVDASFIFQLRKLNYLMQEEMPKQKNVYPIDISAIHNRLGRKEFFDPVLYFSSKMTVAINSLPYVAKCVVDVIKSSNGRINKCVILDLDNTLWGGVVGDDGPWDIEIGELGRGHAFANFQRWLKELKDFGIILAVCSKNNEDTAKEPFENNDEMILKLSDISVFVANWDDKASNIRLIKETLNIGYDSMVFIDDNPFERNLVRQLLPEITVPEMPDDPAQYVEFLQGENLFDTISYTGTNADRTRMYQEEYARKKLEKSYESIDDYLKSLEMVAKVGPFERSKYARIAELSQRSNQFNLRTVRYTEEEIEKIANNPNYITLYFTLKDRFGEYGVISSVIMKRINEHEVFVDTWFMSCRVLKRGMEDFIINSMFEAAKEAGYDTINAEYIPTAKNKMVKDIYFEKGFKCTSENHFVNKIDSYVPKQVWISIGD